MEWLTPIVETAKAIFELGFAPFLVVLFILWLLGKLHTDQEKKDWKELYENEKTEKNTLLRIEREEKLQAIKDRKESDEAVLKLTERLREHDALTQRTLDLNERLLEEFLNQSRVPKRRGEPNARVK